MDAQAAGRRPVGAHLVGSAPLGDAGEMFRLAAGRLGGHLRRLPDGEVGERSNWIRWQHARLSATPQLRVREEPNQYVPVPRFELLPGIESPDDLELPELGYAAAAADSFALFQRLVGEGTIPAGIRFQVGLPTPLAVAVFYSEPASMPMVEAAYEAALMADLDRLLRLGPADRLAVQWETVIEFGLLEGLWPHPFGDGLRDAIRQRLVRLVEAVPAPVEVGLHLCYGDSGHRHFVEPGDAGHLTSVANAVATTARRPLAWVHLPVPAARSDPAYFAPLADLRLAADTDLYLGLLHQRDGLAGAEQRIAAARQVRGNRAFGVATECGLGRRPPETIPGLLELHASVADPVRR
jgi:hypothetical protein